MTAITYTDRGEINEGLKLKVIEASVTATSNTITITDMTTIRAAFAYVSGTEATLLDLGIATNVITTAGHTSGTETWIITVIGI